MVPTVFKAPCANTPPQRAPRVNFFAVGANYSNCIRCETVLLQRRGALAGCAPEALDKWRGLAPAWIAPIVLLTDGAFVDDVTLSLQVDDLVVTDCRCARVDSTNRAANNIVSSTAWIAPIGPRSKTLKPIVALASTLLDTLTGPGPAGTLKAARFPSRKSRDLPAEKGLAPAQSCFRQRDG